MGTNPSEFIDKITNPSEFIDKMKDIVNHLNQAEKIMHSGPLSYYFEKLVQHSHALLTKFTPIGVGEKAIIIRPIKCEGGWKGSEKNLAVGQIGKIVQVDYRHDKFYFEFVPDQQWYQNHAGEYIETEPKHSYLLSELCLAPLNWQNN